MATYDKKPVIAKENLPTLLKYYFILFPFAAELISKLRISDFLILIIILKSFINAAKHKLLKITGLDALFIIFMAFTLSGKYVQTYFSSYFKETLTYIFLYLSLRIIAINLNTNLKLTKAANYLGRSLEYIIYFLAMSVITKILHINFAFNKYIWSGNKIKWLYNYSNQFGIAITVLFPLLFVKNRNTTLKYFIYICYIVIIGAIGARSCFIIALAEIIALEFFILNNNSLKTKILKLMTFIAIFLVLFFAMSSFNTFRRSTGQIKKVSFFYDAPRIKTFRKAFDTFSSVIQGQGLGCFKNNHKYEIHNTFLSIFVEGGLTAFFIYLWLILFFIYPLSKKIFFNYKNTNKIEKLIFICLIAGLSLSMVHNMCRNRAFFIILAFCLSYAYQNSSPKTIKLQH